jgi:hypothetical protein
MAKRRTTRTKTAQLRCADVPDFLEVGSVCLYHVSAVFALISQIQKDHGRPHAF